MNERFPSEHGRSTPGEEANRRPFARRMLGIAAGLSLVAAFSVGCGSSGESTSGGSSDTTAAAESGDGCEEATDGKITIVTENFDFQPNCIDVEGPDLEITYENKEEGVKHDVFFDALDKMTELKAGPNTDTLELTGLKSGTTYDFVCSIHSQMQGEVNVK